MGGPRKSEDILARTPQVALEQRTSETGIWVIEDIATSRVLGNCGLTEKNIDGVDEIELVYLLFASEWGKGYATEAALAVQNHAFSQLRLSRVVALIDPLNTASERVALRLGMEHIRDTVRGNGSCMRVYVRDAPPCF
jgi:RimJ/RimL family protein N-acetyltransferase